MVVWGLSLVGGAGLVPGSVGLGVVLGGGWWVVVGFILHGGVSCPRGPASPQRRHVFFHLVLFNWRWPFWSHVSEKRKKTKRSKNVAVGYFAGFHRNYTIYTSLWLNTSVGNSIVAHCNLCVG